MTTTFTFHKSKNYIEVLPTITFGWFYPNRELYFGWLFWSINIKFKVTHV